MMYSKSGVAIALFVTLIVVSYYDHVDATRLQPFATTAFVQKSRSLSSYAASTELNKKILEIRGGDTTVTDDSIATIETAQKKEKSLDEKVFAAMEKLGLSPPSKGGNDATDSTTEVESCKDGVCSISQKKEEPEQSINPHDLSERLAKEMNVDSRLTMAAIGATSTVVGDDSEDQRVFNESAAREMIQQELDLIESIQSDSEYVQSLTKEGFDEFLSRRALAFSENNLEDARAILMADQMDAEEEKEEEAAALVETLEPVGEDMIQKETDFVEVKSNFDPAKLPATPPSTSTSTNVASSNSSNENNSTPKPAKKESVVFEATSAQLQELVLESPVPVLLDIYADWCGPCKVLGPALEDMAIKSGGMFRVVKINSDNERPISQVLKVTALPTVFGIRDGNIVHMFQGMPKSEDMMRNFMMGLFGAAPFSPSVTTEESEKYEELTKQLIKSASSASFLFSARERLIDRITMKLDDLVQDDSVSDVEGSATLICTLLSNIVNNPYDQKFRKINLENKVVASKIGGNSSCLAVLRNIGFSKSGSEMIVGKGKKVINVAPLVVAKDCIDKWIQRNRKEMAGATRKRKDEIDRARLIAEKGDVDDDDDESEEEIEEIDSLSCRLKLRLDGKNKIRDAILHRDDPLKNILDELGVNWEDEDEVQITCAAKRMVVKSSDRQAMIKTLGEHGLMPAANIVVKVGGSSKTVASDLKGRAADKKIRKTGSHTMQSIGIYAKDDDNKAELIDGGGGTWYEHDVSDDEDEVEMKKDDETKTEETASKGGSEQKIAEVEESTGAENGTDK